MKVLASVFSNLYTDQRVEKVCRTLHENGYEVQLIGNTWDGAPEMHRPYRFSRILVKSRKLRFAYLEFNKKLYHELLKNADKNTILLANDLDALLPNYLVSKRLNIPLVFDSHEIFTEMPSVQGRWVQRVWRILERNLVPKIKFMMTESESYAEWFKEKYAVSPVVVRNIPRQIPSPKILVENKVKKILYQGAINQSRGIPQAIFATKFLENTKLVIAGDGPKRKEYEAMTTAENLSEKVEFLGRLSPSALREITATADVGLSIEENGGVSYLYSLPNKVSDYIQARVPVVMINFPEMQRVYSQFRVGVLTDSHDPKILAEKIKTVLEKGRLFYQPELEKAAQELCWEKEEPKILSLFQEAAKELGRQK